MKPILSSSVTTSLCLLESDHNKITAIKQSSYDIPIIAINDIADNKSIISYQIKEITDKKALIGYIKHKT